MAGKLLSDSLLWACILTISLRIAQWDPNTKRYYFVQPSTGATTWDVPTGSVTSTPAQAQAPYTPPVDSYNPQQAQSPYQNPSPSQQYDAQQDPVTTSRGGPLGGLGGLAQGFLGGGGKHGSHGSGMGGKLGLANSLLSGGKPHGGSSSHGSSGHGGPQAGLMGLAGGLLGGKNKHGSGGHSSGGPGGLLGMAGGLASGLLNSVLCLSSSNFSAI